MIHLRKYLAAAAAALLLTAGAQAQEGTFDVALYYPGDLGSNPVEPPITAGVQMVREAFDDVTVRVIEGGAVADWEAGVIALAATGQYELIISFTDGLPQILETVAPLFPEQRWALLDASAPGVESVYSLVYSDEALGFLGGAVAVLLAANEESSRDVEQPTVGLLAGTPYPAMDEKIRPGYRAGARFVEPAVQVLYAAVGDWYNPNRARDLALNMFNRGATAVMSITGGGDSGAHRAAEESGGYAIAGNTTQNAERPGGRIASVLKRLDVSIYDVVERARAGELPYGTVETVGVEQGAITVADDEHHREHVPEALRERIAEIEEAMRSGEIDYLDLVQQELDE